MVPSNSQNRRLRQDLCNAGAHLHQLLWCSVIDQIAYQQYQIRVMPHPQSLPHQPWLFIQMQIAHCKDFHGNSPPELYCHYHIFTQFHAAPGVRGSMLTATAPSECSAALASALPVCNRISGFFVPRIKAFMEFSPFMVRKVVDHFNARYFPQVLIQKPPVVIRLPPESIFIGAILITPGGHFYQPVSINAVEMVEPGRIEKAESHGSEEATQIIPPQV